MKATLLAALLALQASNALALPQGAWPEEARSLPLGRPGWILVVPATRAADGSIRLWDRQDEWLRSWVVPKATPSGIRTVAISGDSEDQKLIHGEQLDNMRVDSLRILARKYGAEAVAVAVRDDEEEVAVAAWRAGAHATWEEAVSEAGSENPRTNALTVIDALFGEKAANHQAEVGLPDAGHPQVRVVAERLSADGLRMEYRVEIGADQVEALRSSSSVEITRFGEGTADVLVVDGRAIADIISEVGLPAY